MRPTRTLVAAGAVAVLAAASLGSGMAAAGRAEAPTPGRVSPAAAQAPHPSDFNGDGYDDLAIGAPFDDVVRGGLAYNAAGVVHVLYGSSQGLTSNGATTPGTPHSQVWTQDSPNVADVAEPSDHFGSALATGDFNHDGYGDLAIGVPGEDLGAYTDVGAVNILFGSSSGLVGKASQPLVTCCFFGPAASHIQLGSSLVSLDFETASDGTPVPDGIPDLAVGMPGWNNKQGGVAWFSGAVINGGTGQGSYAYEGFIGYPNCRVGASLAKGSFDNNSADDLVIGAPGCDVDLGPNGIKVGAGRVFVKFNGPNGTLTMLTQDAGFRDIPESGDHLGTSVAAADINTDGHDDVLAGVPGEDLGANVDAGMVSIAVRTSDGMSFALGSDITRRILSGKNLAGAQFGKALAVGWMGSSVHDLAIGAPGETVGGVHGAGAVWTMVGIAVVVHRWTQQSTGVADVAEAGDGFGSSLSIDDFDTNSAGDLVVGVPLEDLGTIKNAGAVHVLYAATAHGPISATNSDFWTQNTPGIGETAQTGDRFGFAVH